MNNILNNLKQNKVATELLILTLIATGLLISLSMLQINPKREIVSQPTNQSETSVSIPTPTPFPVSQKPIEFRLRLRIQSPERVINTDYLSATSSGWLVLHEDNNGVPGKVIEPAIPSFDAGVYNQEIFILSEALVTGKSYWAVLYKGGGSYTFKIENAQVATNLKGEKVQQLFTVR